MEIWKTKRPISTCDSASFIGLVCYYRKQIRYFEECLSLVHALMSQYDYNDYLPESTFTPAIHVEMHDLLNAITSDPIVQRVDIKKRFYLRIDACAKGYGNILLQPCYDPVSLAAMNR